MTGIHRPQSEYFHSDALSPCRLETACRPSVDRPIMSPINANLQAVKARIAAAAEGRAVTLVAVSKTQPAERLREAFGAGQHAFGENYVQEALAKQEALRDLAIEWHFIGPIQSNKCKFIAPHFSWVHGVDRLKVAEQLSRLRPAEAGPLNVLVQVNVSGEVSKSGCAPQEASALAHAVAGLANIRLRGLMTIIENVTDPALQRAQFKRLRELADSLREEGLSLDTLSMGMSQDFETAIREGATLVRIGTAVFGARAPKGLAA